MAVEVLQWQFTGGSYALSADASWNKALLGLGLDFRSVLSEELVYRGALFYILFRKLNLSWAYLISSVSFGIYHWFSFGVFGQWFAMIIVGSGTALMGWAWAVALVKSGSLYLLLALHLAWNFFHNTLLGSPGPWGISIWELSEPQAVSPNWIGLVNMFGVPILSLVVLSFWPSRPSPFKSS